MHWLQLWKVAKRDDLRYKRWCWPLRDNKKRDDGKSGWWLVEKRDNGDKS